MAAGKRVLPGPPVVQPMTTDHATAAVQEPIGPESLAQPPSGGRAAGSAKMTGSLPAGVGMPAARAPARAWGGAGGRWLVWVFRALAWTVLLVIGFRGVAAIVTGQPRAGGSAARGQTGQRGFPVSLARAYASGDAVQLAAYSPRGTLITGLGSVVAFGGLVRLVVPAATGPVRHIAVMVRWLPAGSAARPAGASPSPAAGSRSPSASSRSPAASARASVQMSYELTVVRHGRTWLVSAIGPASSQAWPSS